MKELKIGNYKVEILDYVVKKNYIPIDIKFPSKEKLDEFICFYDKNDINNGVIEYSINGENFSGWFGRMIYDKELNMRIYMAIYDGEEIEKSVGSISMGNMAKAINANKEALRELLKILNENGILNEKDYSRIIIDLPEEDYRKTIFRKVDNLNDYLIKSGETLDEMKIN